MTTEDIRQLVRYVTIDAIVPIPDADSIEVARVGGWNIVTRKGEFVPGDLAVYFEIDSMLPLADERFAFLAARGGHRNNNAGQPCHRLKTAKLRGVVSQGLLLPAAQFPELPVVEKYDPPLPGFGLGNQAGHFPSHLARKTDSERIENLSKDWETLRTYRWQLSEKVDGMSSTTIVEIDGTVRICSRNFELQLIDGVPVVDVIRNSILPLIPPGYVVQSEIAGPGIQGNRLGLKEVRPFVFSVSRVGQLDSALPRSEWPTGLVEFAVPILAENMELPESPETIIAEVDGMKSIISPDRLAEGIVFWTDGGVTVPELGRPNFKCVSRAWLLKEK